MKLVSIRDVAAKLLQIGQSNKNEQDDGRIYFKKNPTHIHRNMATLDNGKYILKLSQCKKKSFHASTDSLIVIITRLNELMKNYVFSFFLF